MRPRRELEIVGSIAEALNSSPSVQKLTAVGSHVERLLNAEVRRDERLPVGVEVVPEDV